MKYYFVGQSAFTKAQLVRLRSANIPIVEAARSGWLSTSLGMRFLEEDLLRALEVLGGRIFKEKVLDEYGERQLVEPKFVFDRTPKPVVISEVETAKEIEPLLKVLQEVLLPRSSSDIVLRAANGTFVDPHVAYLPPYSGGRKSLPNPRFIYLWGTFDQLAKRQAIEGHRLWSVDLPPAASLKPPTSSKNPIIDFYNTVVGNVENNVACCLFDLLASTIPVSFAELVLRYFAEDLAEIWFGTKGSQADHAKLRQVQREQFFREALVTLGLRSLDRKLDREQTSLIQLNEKLADLDKEVRILLARRNNTMQVIDRISSEIGEKHESLKDQFDLIRSHKKVTDVIIHPGVIEVRTRTIYCKHKITEDWHEIGEMKILIYTDLPKKDESDGMLPVTVENLTRQTKTSISNGWHHPHVFPEGRLCTGGYYRAMDEYAVAHDYVSLVGLVIFFLEDHSPYDPAGKNLPEWPKLDASAVEELIETGILPAE